MIILYEIFQINDHIENLKTVIDDCLEKTAAADVTLQCISDTVNRFALFYEITGLHTWNSKINLIYTFQTVSNVQGISNGIQDIKSAIVRGWAEVKKIAEETKECLNANAEKGSEDITALIQNVSNCIDSKP